MTRHRLLTGAAVVALCIAGGVMQIDRWAPRWDVAILAVAVVLGWVPGVFVALSTVVPHAIAHHDAWTHFGAVSIFVVCGFAVGAVLRRRSPAGVLPYRTALRLATLASVSACAALVQTAVDAEVGGVNGWTQEFIHLSIGIVAAALVVWLPWRRSRPVGLFAPTLALLVSVSLLSLTAGYWTERDEQLLRLTADSTSFGFLNSLSDEVNVIATKAGTSGETEFTVDSFSGLMQTVVFGHEPITGAALLERSPTGGTLSTIALSDYGPEFEEGLKGWIRQPNNQRLETALSANGVSFVGIARLPVPSGAVEPHFMYYAPLETGDQASAPTTKAIVATVSIPVLLARSLSLALGADNEVTVTLYELGIDSATPLWTANSDLSAQRLIEDLEPVSHDSGSGKSETAALSVDDLAFDLVAARGTRFGTPITTRRLIDLVISLGGLGLFALFLQVNNDRARREAERRRREALLTAALAGAPGWTAVIDEDDRVLVGNGNDVGVPAGGRLVDAGLFVGDRTAAQRVVDLIDQARQAETEPITLTTHQNDTQHEMRIYEVLARRVGDPDPDNLVFLQAVDVTERRELAMRHAQSERMESIGVLAGSLAHDFNNLLFITQGYLQMMERQPQVAGDAQLSRFVSRASEAVQRGATIAKSLLAVARSQPMAAVPVNMRQFIDDLEPLIRQAINSTTKVHLALEIADGEGSDSRRDNLDVLVDPGRMSSAVLNLVFNARDAMEQGGILTVRVERTTATDSEGHSQEVIAISVRDTGRGMSPEVAARAYEPFFTTGKIGKGTGLGLAAVYSFAQQSNGWTTIDSREGVGTTVSIYLPPVIPNLELSATAATMTAGRLRALVVDDEPTLADLVATWLDDLGFDTRVATCSADAFTIAKEFQPQLLLSDSNLGEDIDGADLAAQLSSDLSGLVTVFMTGFSDRMRSLETVGAMTLAKPFSRDDLNAALIKVLGSRLRAVSNNGTAS